jgi:hypothetical protein
MPKSKVKSAAAKTASSKIGSKKFMDAKRAQGGGGGK